MLNWEQYVDLLKPAGELLGKGTAPVDEHLRAEQYRQFVMNLSQGYFLTFQTDPDYPEFVPLENSAFLLQPNPDAVYYYSRVDGAGTYRVIGERGNAIVAGFATGSPIIGMGDGFGKGFNNYDVDDLDIAPDGTFEVIFSQTRPEAYAGNWLYLHPEADFLMLRQFNYHWGRDTDMRVAIERLDPKPRRPRLSPQDTDARLKQLMHYVRTLSNVGQISVRRPHDGGFINRFHLHDFADTGNGSDWPQSYFETVFQLAPDEALVFETDLPDKVHYWNTQVIDGLWNQVEMLYRQSSLNGATAKIDSDGRYRAVLCATDPGYANWLDTGDHPYGLLIGRWYRASNHPVPECRVMKLADVAGYLGDRSPRITPDERAAALRERLIGSQLRRKW